MNVTLQKHGHVQARWERTLRTIDAELLARDIESITLRAGEAAQKEPTPNERHATVKVLRAVQLKSVGNWLASEMAKDLAELEKEVVAAIAQVDPNGAGSPKQQAHRLVTLLKLVDESVAQAFEVLKAETLARFDQLAETLHQHAIDDLQAHHGAASTVEPPVSPLVLGAPLEEHFAKLASDTAFKLKAAIRQGVANGETAEQVARRITGEQVDFRSGTVKAAVPETAAEVAAKKKLSLGVRLFDGTENSVEKVIQSAVQAYANAIDAAVAEGADFSGDEEDEDEPDSAAKAMGYTWVTAGDAKVCPECDFYADAQWDADHEPVNDGPEYPGDPPLHFGCRCSVPVTDLESEKPPQDFEHYLSQFTGKEKEAAFGKANLEAYERGQLTPSQLIGQKDNLMTLEQFRNTRLGGGE